MLFPHETRVVVSARARGAGPLDEPRLEPPPPDLSPRQLETLLADAQHPENLWLVGGEPTLHAELPRLLQVARATSRARVGLVTDGLALADEAAVEPLLRAGLSDVRIQLHAARLDAHDFMVQRKGAARRALAALKALRRLGVRCEVGARLSRVNASGLVDLVELAAELGIRTLHVDRLRLADSAREQAIALLLRLPLAEPALEAAATKAGPLGVQLVLRGFPHCFMGRAAPLAAPTESVQHLLDPAWPRGAWQAEADPLRCDGCSAHCEGASSDYVARFGPTEFFAARTSGSNGASISARSDANLAASKPTTTKPVAAPPPRGARLPSLRLQTVREQAARSDLGGDPVAGAGSRQPEPSLRFGWRGPQTLACQACNQSEAPSELQTTRTIRQRLVRAAQYGAGVLRVAGTDLLSHPDAGELLEELPRLSFDTVELGCVVQGPIFPAFAGLSRVDMALFGSDTNAHDAHVGAHGAFAHTLEGVRQLSALGVAGGCFAVLHSAEPVVGFADAWDAGRLPGVPTFRLAEAGGSLDALAATLERLPPAAQRALGSLLPSCVCAAAEGTAPLTSVTFIERAEPNRPVSSADRLGRFLPCQCGPERAKRCPGVAAGWHARGLEAQP